jgi:hypothetical protein
MNSEVFTYSEKIPRRDGLQNEKERTDEKINNMFRKMSIFMLIYDKNKITIYPKYNHNFTISSIVYG